MSDVPCFGIDLGTSCSAIGFVEHGVPRLIEIDGNVLVPSVVTFSPSGEVLVGRAALNSLQAMPERTIVSSKRLMGRGHTYAITGDDGAPITPVDVAARILRVLLDGAEAATGIRPERAVITVPAWFTQAQRADTRAAGAQAGIEVARIINEPTAAALAHAHGNDVSRRALVYDLGGGTFDVSVVQQDGPVVEVKASHGNSELGGDDVDVLLRDRVLDRLDRQDEALSLAIQKSPAAMLRLRVALEKIKIELGVETESRLEIPFLVTVDGTPRHIALSITRDELEAVAGFVIHQTLESVDQVLKDTDMLPGDVDELLLVGGSTKLNLVWKILHERYNLEGSHAVPPRDAVALGAAIQAAIIDGHETAGMLFDVAPYSLSVGVADPRQSTKRIHFVTQVITPRNAPLPSRHLETFYSPGKQSRFEIPVFQGANNDPRLNTYLGNVVMDGLAPLEEDDAYRRISVEFSHDLDGLVSIHVTDEGTGRRVESKLASDGAEQQELRTRWLENMVRNNVVFGDGDPEAHEGSSGINGSGGHKEGLSSRAADAAEIAAARKTCESVLAAGSTLREEHPEDADRLILLAERGLSAIDRGADAEALEFAQALDDLMFDLGIYL